MNRVFVTAILLVFINIAGADAQTVARQAQAPPTASRSTPASAVAAPATPAASPSLPDVNPILDEIRRVAPAAGGDIRKLRIEKWKAESSQRRQMEQVAESLQRNITTALPGLANDLQASPESVSKAFKLYHNLNVVYEFLNALAEAAGTFGKGDEYEPLAKDVSALDDARQNLSSYIEQAAGLLESKDAKLQARQSAATAAVPPPPPKKIVIDDTQQPAKAKKVRKKPAAAPAQPTPTPSGAAAPQPK